MLKHIKYISFLILSLTAFHVQAQEYTTVKTAHKKVIKCYDKAKTHSRAEQFPEALEQLNKALEIDPLFIDGKILRASLLGASGMLSKAESEFEAIIEMDKGYSPRVLYELALTEKDLKKYEEAAHHFEEYLNSAAKSKIRKKKAGKHLINSRFAAEAIQNPVPFEPQNLGDNINSTTLEYLPSITADKERLVFTVRVGNQEDFYYSTKKDGAWQPRQPIETINTADNEGAQCISADGKLLVFTRCNPKAGRGGCDLYFSNFEFGSWTTPQKIYGTVNSHAWEGQPSLSADGQMLYFASDRKGGYGKRDLWVSHRRPNGEWGDPINLGKEINTPDNDQCPFIHADSKTLYFCSEGHPGMGGIDLYFSKRDKGGKWAAPQNLGYPINTPANEGTMVISVDGKTAYYASDYNPEDNILDSQKEILASSKLNIDIFSFELHEDAQPDPVTYLKAKVVDIRSRRGLKAKAEIVDLESGKVVANTQSDEKGNFLLCLPSGMDYALHVSREKFLFYSENFSLTEPASVDEPFEMTIMLQPVPKTKPSVAEAKKQPIVLKNIFFETGSAALKQASAAELDRLVNLLTDNPDLRIQINGHTDDVGEEQDNLKLSEDRAKAVYDHLVSKNIAIERLKFKGFGESSPIADNNSEEGRKINRRTEFIVW